ncbi:MAG: GyrI-like domain-containing protein [Fluviicola sp.]|nr:MAG: GyrI-like domain-containing protein [Fluviicola sp.]
MEPKIENLNQKKLVGLNMKLSLANYNIVDLWKRFGPRRKEITNNLTSDLISIAVYAPNHFKDFKPSNEFERWATIEVSDFSEVPPGMDTFELQGGLYAVFDYKGLNTDNAIYRYIFEDWLPDSIYKLDHRPHFEVLGAKYKNNDPDSEEEIWIPIKKS